VHEMELRLNERDEATTGRAIQTDDQPRQPQLAGAGG
jgi:hypothetical protein